MCADKMTMWKEQGLNIHAFKVYHSLQIMVTGIKSTEDRGTKMCDKSLIKYTWKRRRSIIDKLIISNVLIITKQKIICYRETFARIA